MASTARTVAVLFALMLAGGIPLLLAEDTCTEEKGACASDPASVQQDHALFQKLGPMLKRFAQPAALAETSKEHHGGSENVESQDEEVSGQIPDAYYEYEVKGAENEGGADRDRNEQVDADQVDAEGESEVGSTVQDDHEWGHGTDEEDEMDDETRLRRFEDQERLVMEEERRSMLKMEADFSDAATAKVAKSVKERFQEYDGSKEKSDLDESSTIDTPTEAHWFEGDTVAGSDERQEDEDGGSRDQKIRRLVRIRNVLRELIQRQGLYSHAQGGTPQRSVKDLVDHMDELEEPPQDNGRERDYDEKRRDDELDNNNGSDEPDNDEEGSNEDSDDVASHNEEETSEEKRIDPQDGHAYTREEVTAWLQPTLKMGYTQDDIDDYWEQMMPVVEKSDRT